METTISLAASGHVEELPPVGRPKRQSPMTAFFCGCHSENSKFPGSLSLKRDEGRFRALDFVYMGKRRKRAGMAACS